MRLILILGALIVLGSTSCRRYETCATYSDNSTAKITEEKSI